MRLMFVSLALVFGLSVTPAVAYPQAAITQPPEKRWPAHARGFVRERDALKTTGRTETLVKLATNMGSHIVQPAPGYTWANPKNKDDLKVKVRDDLRRVDGGFVPAHGYRWVDQDHSSDLRVIRIGLIQAGDSTIRPDSGYTWLTPDNAKDMRVRVRDGLVAHPDGSFTPAKDYVWASGNANDLAVVFEGTNNTAPIPERTLPPTGQSRGNAVDAMAGASRPTALPPTPMPTHDLPANGPSLTETRDWLMTRVPTAGSFSYTVEQAGLLGPTQGAWNRRIENLDLRDCKLSFVRRSIYGGGSKKGRTWRASRITANLSALDPAAVKIEQGEDGPHLDERATRVLSIWWWKVIAPVAPGSTAVLVEIVESKDPKLIGTAYHANFLDLDSTDRELSKRISTALSHAIELCGGKVEPF